MSNPGLDDNILVCQPLKDLKSVLEWDPPENSWAKLVIKKSERTSYSYRGCNEDCHASGDKLPEGIAPKTLVCHDMKGGYLEDKYVYGSNKHDEFRFMHWSSIDIFVYFSHHFITIPPLAWINAGHKHGVPVLGTIITEWKDGQSVWNEVLGDPSKCILFCEKLSEICVFYGFDGYLLNVESTIKASQIFSLVDFVKMLKSSLLSVIPDSLLYWYDSVIIPSGEIKYQNKLNENNIGFFDACDGIFLNYNWTKSDLLLSSKNGSDRNHDIFVGVDVFGRNCYGGGGFNTRLAVEVAGSFNLSVALFAPGWVHETLPSSSNYIYRDYMFWSAIRPLMYTRGPACLPFFTSFCQGYGEKRYYRGIVVSELPWYDLSKQEYQPTDIVGPNSEIHCISHYNLNAFNGGSCLRVKRCFLNNGRKALVHRLFITEFKFTQLSTIRISLVISSIDNTSIPELILVLSLEDFDGTLQRKALCSREEMESCHEEADFIFPKSVQKFKDNRITTWYQRDFEFRLEHTTVVGIGCLLGKSGESVLLGMISIDSR